MQRTTLLGLLAVTLVLVVSCGTADKSAIAVPKDAAVVLHINTASLSSKLSWKEIQETNWFKEAYADADDSLAKKLLDNPDNSGIDTDVDLVFFVKRQSKHGYAVFEGGLKDAAAFESFNKKIKRNATVSKDGDLSILKLENDGIATWKDGRFIYVYDAPMASVNRFDEDGQSGAVTVDSLIGFAKSLYDLKGDASLTSDSKFSALLKEAGDVHIWFSAESLYGDMLGGMLSTMKIGDFIKGNVSAATLSFDNGKILIKGKTYYNKEVVKLMEKYKTRNLDADALARIPSDNVTGVLAYNFPPDGLKEFLKQSGLDGMTNAFLGEIGYSVDEFIKANKGDLILAVTDFNVKSEQVTYPSYEEGGQPYTYNKTTPDAKVLFAVSINDKPAFDKMVSAIKAKIGESPAGGMPKISYSLNDKWFAAGNAEDQVNKFLSGGADNKQPYISKISGHPFGLYIDLQKILKASDAATTDSAAKVALAESINMWEDVLATGGEFSNGGISSQFEINLVDKNTNSLKQLNQYIDKLAGTRKKGF